MTTKPRLSTSASGEMMGTSFTATGTTAQRGPVRHRYSPSALLAATSCTVISSEEEDVLSQAAIAVRRARSSRGLTRAVRLVAVRKTYGPAVAVASVDLEIGGGEFFTLLGPSGSGKTT